MKDPQWVQCRLRRETLERLRRWAERTLKAVRYAPTEEKEEGKSLPLGVDVAVSIMLDRSERHRERSRNKKK